MRIKTFVKTASLASGAVLAFLFVLKAVIMGMANEWANQGVELNIAQRILIGVGIWWSRFWWLGWPFVIGGVFWIVGVIAILQLAFAKASIK